MNFTPIVVTIGGTPVTFGAETLTPQETILRDVTNDQPYSALQNAKIGFSTPTPNRPTSFVLSRVYKTPILNALGQVTGSIRTDVKTTTPITAGPSDRARHQALVAGIEGHANVISQQTDLVSWY